MRNEAALETVRESEAERADRMEDTEINLAG